ncbi:MAG: Fic family protein [Actinobacteria bacterium]|nr:Fic family protein [Actinomycetota bacterium]
MKRPTLGLAVAFNRAVRGADEWFDEPDDLDRVARAIGTVDDIEDPVVAAAQLAYRVTWTQGFGEGNKRTALLLARWVLDQNGLDGAIFLPPEDREFATLLVKAASGTDVEAEIIALLIGRR